MSTNKLLVESTMSINGQYQSATCDSEDELRTAKKRRSGSAKSCMIREDENCEAYFQLQKSVVRNPSRKLRWTK